MFTGIVIDKGRIVSLQRQTGTDAAGADVTLSIAAGTGIEGLQIGASISVQGVCLTVTRLDGANFHADVSNETLSKTTLGSLRPGSAVNLEPALRAGDALGGHLVSGHVDGIAQLIERHEDARSWRMTFQVPAPLARFVAAKGSVCLDGVSLTVNGVQAASFDVNIIPHTMTATTLGERRVGEGVNFEIDLIARYLDRLLSKP
jgi:riboflavin synthase